MTSQARAFLLAGLTVLAWSTVSTAFKLALEDLGPMQLIFVSMSTAAIFLGAFLAARGGFGKLVRLGGRLWAQAALLGFMLYCYYALLFMAYARLPAQIAQPINYTWALMLALLAAWVLRQRLTPATFGCMLFAYSGVVIIALGKGGSQGPLDPLGLACVMASTLLYAVYWIVNTRSALPTDLGLFLSFSVAALLAAATLATTGQALLLPVRHLMPGIYVGLFELAIPFLLWGMALKLTYSVARLSTLPFLVPFLALFWIRLIIKEPIAWTTVVGLVFIVSGTVMQQRLARHGPTRAAADPSAD